MGGWVVYLGQGLSKCLVLPLDLGEAFLKSGQLAFTGGQFGLGGGRWVGGWFEELFNTQKDG